MYQIIKTTISRYLNLKKKEKEIALHTYNGSRLFSKMNFLSEI